MAKGEPARHSDLPAPYRSPWRGLAEALAAVAADLRLGLRGLLRRNLQGELPRPRFWPAALAPVFWPLLLAALLAGLPAAARSLHTGWRALHPQAAPTRPGEVERFDLQAGGAAGPAGSGQGMAAGPRPSPAGSAEVSAPPVPSPALPPASPGGGRAAGGTAAPGRVPAEARQDLPPAASDAAPAMPLRLDPLLALLTDGEDAGLLLAARPDPDRSRLSLTLAAAALALPRDALLAQAERWQLRAREAGYEQLELRDGQGRLRGRGALVGSGMILLAPAPPA